MEQEIIKLLDPNLECIRCKLKKQQIVFEVQSLKEKVPCPLNITVRQGSSAYFGIKYGF